jgi:hypothetical protein
MDRWLDADLLGHTSSFPVPSTSFDVTISKKITKLRWALLKKERLYRHHSYLLKIENAINVIKRKCINALKENA